MNLTTVNLDHVDETTFDTSNQGGFFVGPTVKFSAFGIGFDVSALYDYRHCRIYGSELAEKYIDFPINLRYDVGIGDVAGLFLAAGPQFAFNIGDKNYSFTHPSSITDDVSTWRLRDSVVSFNLGGGCYVGRLQVSLHYNIPLGSSSDITFNKVWDTLTHSDKAKTRTWQMAATIYL